MSCARWCAALACLAAALWLAPRAAAVPTSLLAHVAGKTICESVVVYDERADRIPRIIKQIKCAASPDKMCPARDGSGAQTSCCTQNSYLNTKYSCQEVRDYVLVSDTEGVTSQQTVTVGCQCIMQQSMEGEEV